MEAAARLHSRCVQQVHRVQARTASSARTPGPMPHHRFTSDELRALDPGRQSNSNCAQASPRTTEGPFFCRNCRFTCTIRDTTDATPIRHTVLHTPTSKADTNISGEINCLLINAYSLGKHDTEIWDTIKIHTPDTVFITETWLNPTSAPDIATASHP